MKKRNLTIRKFFNYALVVGFTFLPPQIASADTQLSIGSVVNNLGNFGNNISQSIQTMLQTTKSVTSEISKNITDVKELATDVVQTTSKAVKETSIKTSERVTQVASTQSASVTSALNDGLEKVYGFAIDKTANVFIPFFIRTESIKTPSLTIQNFSTSTPKQQSSFQSKNIPPVKKQISSSETIQQTVVTPATVPVVNFPRNTVNDILVQNILRRLIALESKSVIASPINQYISNTYTGGASYSVPADTTSYTNTTVNSVVNTAVTSLQEQISLISSSGNATNTFAFILATSTTATSTFAGNINVNGDAEVGGNITATTFFGDGSNLTGITSFSTSTTRSVFSSTATGLSYDNATGVTSLTSGYNIPLTASTTEWVNTVSNVAGLNSSVSILNASTTNLSTFFQTPSTRIAAGTGLSWSGNTLNNTGVTSVTGDWTGTFDGQEGTYYLSRANHTGTQLSSTISDFNTATDVRVSSVLSATTSLPNITTLAGLTTAGNLATVGTLTSGSIGSGFGNINIGSNTFTGNGSGLAALNASNISTGVLTIARGGTGTTTIPTFGQLLMGNTLGGYDLVATSSLGISGGLSSLNSLTDSVQTFATGTAGTNFNISSSGGVHTFNIPDASASNRGLVTTGAQDFIGIKTFNSSVLIGSGSTLGATLVSAHSISSEASLTLRSGATGKVVLQRGNGVIWVEGLVLDSTGNIGIGSSTPTARLTVMGTSTSPTTDLFRVASSTGSPLFAISSAGKVGIGSDPNSLYALSITGGLVITGSANAFGAGAIGISGNALTFAGGSSGYEFRSSANSAQMSLSSGGNLGIGTTTPSAKLAVTGTAGTGDIFNIASSTNASLFKIGATGATYFNNDAGTLGMVLLSNGIGSSPTWVATSSLGISGGGGSGTVNSGLTGQVAFYAADGTAVSGTSTLFFANGNVGIGTTTPSASFTVQSNVVGIGAGTQKVLSVRGASYSGGGYYGGGIELIAGANANIDLRTTPGVDASGEINIITGDGGEATNGINLLAGGALYDGGSITIRAGAASSGFGGGGGSVTINGGLGTGGAATGGVSLANEGGNVGIGTTADATARLTVYGSSASSVVLKVASSTGASLFNVLANGRVGVGTTSPVSAFAVSGTTTLSSALMFPATVGIVNGAENLLLSTAGYATLFMGGAGSPAQTTTLGNIGIGLQALSAINTGGAHNVAIGYNAGRLISTATRTVFIGTNSGDANVTSSDNIGIGYDALTAMSGTSLGNTALGTYALNSLTTNSSYNIAIGKNAGTSLTSGTGNIIIGSGSSGNGVSTPSSTSSNTLNIGGVLWGTGMNTVSGSSIGDGNIGIGTSTPSSRLAVMGTAGGTTNLFTVASSTGSPLFAISSAGNIGIGTSTSAYTLKIGSGQSSFPFGSAAQPSVTFNSEEDSGMYFRNSGVGVSSNGNEAIYFENNSAIYFAGQLRPSSGATASSPAYSFNSDFDTGMYRVGADQIGFSTGGVNRIIIDSTGNIGIGSSTPTARLTVMGTSTSPTTDLFTVASSTGSSLFKVLASGRVGVGTVNPTQILDVRSSEPSINVQSNVVGNSASIKFADSAQNNIFAVGTERSSPGALISGSIANYAVLNSAGTGIHFGASNAIKMTIHAGGNVGIGTTTPGQSLTVVGTIQATNLLGGSTNLTVDANGNIIRDPSDEALKENVVTLSDSLSKIMSLRGVRYEWRDKTRFGTSSEIGVIAQEVELVVPEVVSSGGLYKSVNIKNLVALLIEGVKELKIEFDVVKEKVLAISAWFGSDGDRLNVKGLICVDDVCVTKDQFKQILINSGSVMTLPASTGSIGGGVSPNVESGTGTNSSETPSGETGSSAPVNGGAEETGGSSGADAASSDEVVTPSGSTESAPTTEPTTPPVVSTPPTESVVVEPAPAPSPAPAPEPAPAPAPTE